MAFERSHKENKYDRQMRLWGSQGQHALERAHLCVLGSSATASEYLRSLVLPNVGAFTIIDNAVLGEEDIGNNWFITNEDLTATTQPSSGACKIYRAEVLMNNLRELNEDCKGRAVIKDVTEYLLGILDSERANGNTGEALTQFSMIVICVALPNDLLTRLSEYCANHRMPLLRLRAYGLIATARIQVAELPLLDTHPVSERAEFFIHPSQLTDWNELRDYIESFNLFQPSPLADESADIRMTLESASKVKSLTAEEHSHVPYLVVLAYALRLWLQSHTLSPQNYDEKQQFKESIRGLRWSVDEENFDEAIENAQYAYESKDKDDKILKLISDPRASIERLTALSQSLKSSSSHNGLDSSTHPTSFFSRLSFWISVAALGRFVNKLQRFPVSESLPDMHSKTDYYIQLKRIFTKRAKADLDVFIQNVRDILVECDQQSSLISLEYLINFVKNSRNVCVMTTRTIAEELALENNEFFTDAINELMEEESEEAEEAASEPDNGGEVPFKVPDPLLVHWYLGLRCVDRFYSAYGHYPGLFTLEEQSTIEASADEGGDDSSVSDAQWMHDAKTLTTIGSELWAQYKLSGHVNSDVLTELSRYGACIPHTSAAFIGGVGAQITVKVLMQQFIPLNHTLLFNGIHCRSAVLNV